ncbi:thiol-disulfide oxidoreductase ResA [Bacillaceae bacterium S4-13-58]
MDKKRKRFWFRLLLLLVLVGLTIIFIVNSLQDEKKRIDTGDMAPDFILETLDGEKVQLSDYRGQGVFLNFWATYCPPCKEEMPYMENQYHYFKDKGVTVLAVDVGEPKVTVEGFVNEYGLTFPILLDPSEDVMSAYGIGQLPVTFLVDKEGMVIDRITSGLTEEQIYDYMEQIQP